MNNLTELFLDVKDKGLKKSSEGIWFWYSINGKNTKSAITHLPKHTKSLCLFWWENTDHASIKFKMVGKSHRRAGCEAVPRRGMTPSGSAHPAPRWLPGLTPPASAPPSSTPRQNCLNFLLFTWILTGAVHVTLASTITFGDSFVMTEKRTGDSGECERLPAKPTGCHPHIMQLTQKLTGLANVRTTQHNYYKALHSACSFYWLLLPRLSITCSYEFNTGYQLGKVLAGTILLYWQKKQ